MKKVFLALFAVALLASGSVFAEDAYVAGGFEASGHIFTGAGWQRFKTSGGTFITNDINGTLPGVVGEYVDSVATAAAAGNKEDQFRFFVDEIELDLAKTFGENIRFRADLDFGSRTFNSGPRFTNLGNGGIQIEQAYATANISVGNGLELLLGRFNAPIGFESVDTVSNDTISRSIIYRALRPNTFTGAKFYYAFSDLVDFHWYVVNSPLTHDTGDLVTARSTDIPATGFRLGFNWGEEGHASTFGVSGAWGQDHPARKTAWTFLGDVDWNWWATDNFAFGGEAIYRQIDSTLNNARNGKYFGGLLNLHYNFSDVWDGTLKYAYAHDVNGAQNAGILVPSVLGGAGAPTSLTGFAAAGIHGQQFHELALAGNYAITDGAKLKLEGGYTMINPQGGNNNQHVFGMAGGFAYEF